MVRCGRVLLILILKMFFFVLVLFVQHSTAALYLEWNIWLNGHWVTPKRAQLPLRFAVLLLFVFNLTSTDMIFLCSMFIIIVSVFGVRSFDATQIVPVHIWYAPMRLFVLSFRICTHSIFLITTAIETVYWRARHLRTD